MRKYDFSTRFLLPKTRLEAPFKIRNGVLTLNRLHSAGVVHLFRGQVLADMPISKRSSAAGVGTRL
jgi:hypothetical protein